MEPAGPGAACQEAGLAGGRDDRQSDRGQQEQRRGGDHHAGGVIPGKPGDEILTGGFLFAGVLHQVQNLGDGGFLAGLGHPHPQHAGLIHAAADDVVPYCYVPGDGLAGEGGGVQSGGALDYLAVQGYPLAGLYHDNRANGNVLRVYLLNFAVLPFQVGGVGTNVHQGGDGLPGLTHGIVLEQLAHLVEQHDEHGFGVFRCGEGTHGGQGHQEVFVEHLAVFDVADGLVQHIPADDGVGRQVAQGGQQALLRQHAQGAQHFDHHQQRRRNYDAPNHFFLFFAHGSSLLDVWFSQDCQPHGHPPGDDGQLRQRQTQPLKKGPVALAGKGVLLPEAQQAV